ncbi:MAG: hypothetical protein EHM49_00265 [Deltaproteobacteria bacterium]|nr:MAG: hypothetical protein EHM49_00265 [Deltaproteobacteria bacterium]
MNCAKRLAQGDQHLYTETMQDNVRQCQKLAVAVIAGAVKDLIRRNADIRSKAENWIFADRFSKDFSFWCDIADMDPATVRKGILQIKGVEKFRKKSTGMRGYG